MPYATTVSGPTGLSLQGTLYWLYEQFNPNGTTAIPGSDVIETSAVAANGALSFNANLTAPNSGYLLGLGVSTSGGVLLFRSGAFATFASGAPASGGVTVMQLPPITKTVAELSAGITLPIHSGNTTITALALTINGTSFTAAGTGTNTDVTPVGFTFSYSFNLVPDTSIRDTTPSVLVASRGAVAMNFTAGTGGGLESSLLNAFNAVGGFVDSYLTPQIQAAVQSQVNGAINATTPVPASVVVTISNVALASGSATFTVFLGGFGSAVTDFVAGQALQGASATGSGCFIATAAMGDPEAPDVVLLRRFRDLVLLGPRGGALGSAFVRGYARTSPPLAAIIAGHGPLRRLIRAMIVKPAARLARHYLGGL